MLQKTKFWYKNLSHNGKWAVWTAVLAVGVFGMVASANPSTKQLDDTALSESKSVQAEQKPVIEKQTVTETQIIPFSSTTINDGNLESGKTAVRTVGVNGVKTLTYEVIRKDGLEQSKALIKEEMITEPITQVTAIGTYVKPAVKQPSCDPNYTPCVPNVSYDLDCADVGFRVRVVGYDRHGLDGNDNDGLGCESY